MNNLAGRLDRALKAAGVPVVSVTIVDAANPATWNVHPRYLQADAQPIIDAFDHDDPAHAAAELTALALADSRRKDILATVAIIVKERDVAAWNAMTITQKVEAVRNEADIWKAFREFIDDKAV